MIHHRREGGKMGYACKLGANNYSYGIISIFKMTHTSYFHSYHYVYDPDTKMSHSYSGNNFSYTYKDILTIQPSYSGLTFWIDAIYHKDCKISNNAYESTYDIEANFVNKSQGTTERLLSDTIRSGSPVLLSTRCLYIK